MDTKSSGSKKAKTTSKTDTKSVKRLKYSNLSVELTDKLDKETKKNNGIFFTPPERVKKNLKFLKPYFESGDIKKVLEPSCGSGEYIMGLKKLRKKLDSDKKFKITGIEYNKDIYDGIKDPLSSKSTKIINDDYLKFTPSTKYDLIIGNPPYYVMRKDEVDTKKYTLFTGRPNIFCLFIEKSFRHLNPNGILSFILPKNFLNSSYYTELRRYIEKRFRILAMDECSEKYIETGQDTIMMIIQNSSHDLKPLKNTDSIMTDKIIKQNIKENNKYIAKGIYGFDCIFLTSKNCDRIKELYKNSSSLESLDFRVRVGRIVWNQHKDILTDDDTQTRLIYSSDIKDGKLEKKSYKNPAKKNYIKKKGINEIMLLVNRGYGKGAYSFDYCLVNVDYDYLVENHLICITHGGPYKDMLTRKQLIHKFNSIIKSFEDPRTKEFVEYYFGNNAISTSELNYALPIYV